MAGIKPRTRTNIGRFLSQVVARGTDLSVYAGSALRRFWCASGAVATGMSGAIPRPLCDWPRQASLEPAGRLERSHTSLPGPRCRGKAVAG